MITPVRLAGGSVMLADTVPGTEAVSVGFWFPMGSRHETAAERGYTHFAEHMLFKGTAKRSARDIAREIDRVGGYLNAFTERDCVSIHCTLPAKHLDLAVDVMSDMAFSSTIDEREFEKERQVIVNEILAAEDDPEDCSNDEYLKTVWPGSRMSQKIAGDVADVERVTRDSLSDFVSRRFVPASLTVAVAGPCGVDELSALLDKSIPASGAPHVLCVDVAPEFKPAARFVSNPGQQVHCYAGIPVLPPFGPDEYYLLSVASCAFGESMSSRLFQELRENRGLCYTVFSWASLASDSGLFSVYGATSPDQFWTFMDALEAELVSFRAHGLSELEVEEAKSHLEGATLMASEDPETRMKRLARQWFYDEKVYTVGESLDAIRRVTRDGVNSVMKEKVFASPAFGVTAYGPKPRGFRKLKPLLGAGGNA